jgi:DNA-binding NarL/FixJ family response regulator
MEDVKVCIKQEEKSGVNSFFTSKRVVEVAVVEDNKLFNLILSNELSSAVNKIKDRKDCTINFSNFHKGTDFLNFLEDPKNRNSKIIVFSDYYLEDEMNGAVILKRIKQKEINARVVITSDITNKQTSEDTLKIGALRFIPKDINTPLICSEMLYQLLD